MSGNATSGDPIGSRWSVGSGDAGSLATRIGAGIALASLPIAVFPALAVLVDPPAGTGPVAALGRAVTAPPALSEPVAGTLSIGVLGVLVGVWYLGVGLLLARLRG